MSVRFLALPFGRRPVLGSIHYCAAAAWLLAVVSGGFGLWAIHGGGGEDYRAFYIVKAVGNGKCTIAVDRPQSPRLKLIWIGNQQVVAERKVREFINLYKCR